MQELKECSVHVRAEPFLNMQALPDWELNQHKTTPKYKCGGKNPDGEHEIHLNIKAKLNNGEVMEQNGMEQNGYDLYKEIILTSKNWSEGRKRWKWYNKASLLSSSEPSVGGI